MKRIIYYIAFILLFPSFVFCQEKDTFPKTFLWEISGNGMRTPSYLYGTIHVICLKDMELPDVLTQKVRDAKQLFLETTITEKIDKSATHLFLSKDSTIADLLGDEYQDKAQSLITDSTRIDLSLVAKLKPFVLARLVDIAALNCNATSYEMEFVKIAKQRNTPLLGLETIEEHAAITEMLPMQVQLMQLKMKLSKPEVVQKLYAPMFALYKQKKIWQMYSQTASLTSMGGAGFKEKLLDNRNRNWIPIMEKAMQTGPVFFAVGAAHLPGEVGVINLLKERGYTIMPIIY